MAKLNNVEIHFKHSNRTYNTMTAFLVMIAQISAKAKKFTQLFIKHLLFLRYATICD